MFSSHRLAAAVVLVAAGLTMTGCSTFVVPPQPTAPTPAPVVTAAATQTIAEGCALVKKATAASNADLASSAAAIKGSPSLAGPKFRAFAVALEGVMPQITNPNVTLVATATDMKVRGFMHSLSAYTAKTSTSNASNLEASAIGAVTSSESMSVLCF